MTPQLTTAQGGRFRVQEFGTTSQFLSSLGRKSKPVAVMFTCWELGVIPDEVAHAQPGEIIVVQNPAGVGPPWDEDDCGAAAALEWALSQPSVRHLIVCGHRNCRVLPLLLSDRQPELLREFRHLVRDIRENLGCWEKLEHNRRLRDRAVQEVVLQQLAHLKTYPPVKEHLSSGDLLLHGWFYNDQAAVVQAYDPELNDFSR
jgi:carbonic anhydrase